MLADTYVSISFYINLPFGGIAATAMAFEFNPPKAATPARATLKEKILQMDLLGMAFLRGSITCFALGMRWAGVEKSWGSSDVVGTLVGTVLLAAAFGVDQGFKKTGHSFCQIS